MLRILRRLIYIHKQEKFRKRFALKGYSPCAHEIKYIDSLSDTELIELNNILRWNCFTVDKHGRRFGNAAWRGKRIEPERIPDERILLLNERFNLADKDVLEIGCFEGIHTIGLARYARRVTAIDARVENVVKTIVRCAMFGHRPRIFKCNIEDRPLDVHSLRADVVYHVGVLYHLRDPVKHLMELGDFIRVGALIDTHYAVDQEATEVCEVKGRVYRYKKCREGSYCDAFSGMYEYSMWLRLGDIVEILGRSGFGKVEIVETRNERNGPRVLLIAERSYN